MSSYLILKMETGLTRVKRICGRCRGASSTFIDKKDGSVCCFICRLPRFSAPLQRQKESEETAPPPPRSRR